MGRDNYFNYFTEIEDYFIRKRQRNLMISPLDWCLVELWKENQIPLHVVQRGIDRSFEQAAERARKAPRTLYYCHPAVMEAWEEYQEALVGGEEDEDGTGLRSDERREVSEHLERLLEALSARMDDPSRRAVERLRALRQEVEQGHPLTLRRLDEELESLGSQLVRELGASIDSDRVKKIEAAARAALKPYRRRLSKEMFARLKEKHLENEFRRELGLPDFSLLASHAEE